MEQYPHGMERERHGYYLERADASRDILIGTECHEEQDEKRHGYCLAKVEAS